MFRRIYVFLFLPLFALQCTRDFSVAPDAVQRRELTSLEKQIVESDQVFGLKLFKEIVKNDADENIFISPLSVAMALGMTYNGASGTTEEAMRNTLEFGDLTFEEINESFKSLMELFVGLDSKVQFQIANSIWYRLGFYVEPDFINVNKFYFNAEVRGLDFSSPDAPGIINNWVNVNTHGKIEEIIDAISPLTVMFLINAIYFKGTWTYAFDRSLTTDAQFTTSDGSRVPCRMMEQECDLPYFETDDFQAVDMPYGDGLFSMTVFLPKPGTSVNELIEEFTPENWAQWMGSFSETTLTLHMPKFKLEYEDSLNRVLTNLGMGIAFSDQADFTRINRNGGLFISMVKHKTFVEVDEEGTEAAAVTVVEIRYTSTGLVMTVDRPFVFVIRERQSNALLFMGKIVEPSLE